MKKTSAEMCSWRLVMAGLFAALLLMLPLNVSAQSSLEDYAALGGTAVTLTSSTVTGDVGVDLGGIVATTASTVIGTVHTGDPSAVAAYADFLSDYDALASDLYPCETYLLPAYTDASLVLPPGIYCFEAAATFTRTELHLDAQGDEDAEWIFKVGTLGTGALTGTGLSVILANGAQPCNVAWWTSEAVTFTTSNVKGSLLSGTAITSTGGSFIGQAFAQAGVTLTGADLTSCKTWDLIVDPPIIDEETCSEFINEETCSEFCPVVPDCSDCKRLYEECKDRNKDCKKHDKDCKKHDKYCDDQDENCKQIYEDCKAACKDDCKKDKKGKKDKKHCKK